MSPTDFDNRSVDRPFGRGAFDALSKATNASPRRHGKLGGRSDTSSRRRAARDSRNNSSLCPVTARIFNAPYVSIFLRLLGLSSRPRLRVLRVVRIKYTDSTKTRELTDHIRINGRFAENETEIHKTKYARTTRFRGYLFCRDAAPHTSRDLSPAQRMTNECVNGLVYNDRLIR